MLRINNKDWIDLKDTDIKEFLSNYDNEESFFFEFKEDDIKTTKLAKEISALANTYGGYIFLGVSNSKEIMGCSAWNEQRIHTTIHDSVTPTPSFDIKSFLFDNKAIFVVKIDEGAEPPYITNQGKIYERLSSGSFPINDSIRLSQLYIKREQLLSKMEQKISIAPVTADVNNVYGYIDIGFIPTFSDSQQAIRVFYDADLLALGENRSELHSLPKSNLARIANTIYYTVGGITSINTSFLPAHTESFLEIMCDGSARMRVLLLNNNPKDTTVNMYYPLLCASEFRMVYTMIMGSLFPNLFVYAKKYEAITVLKQFQPSYDAYRGQSGIKHSPELDSLNKEILSRIDSRRAVLGVDNVVTNNRIPKTGLYTIDRSTMQNNGIEEYSSDSLIEELFYSSFYKLGSPY